LGWHRVADIRTPDAKGLCGNDIALLILSDNIGSSEATPATPAVEYPMTDRSKYPSMADTAIGYGLTAPDTNTAGTRRIKSNIDIQCVPGDAQLDCDPNQVFGGTAKEFLAGDGTCEGDSGSGAYEQTSFQAGTFVALGVLSRGGQSTDGKTCLGAIYTRTDAWKDFIRSTAVDAAQKGG